MELGHLLTCSGLARLEILLMVPYGSSCLLVCSFCFSVIYNWEICYMLQPVSFVFLYFVQNSGYI